MAGQAEVYLDGGIRRGTDVFKALALGARAVLIGRPIFWGLAVEGETGVRMVLEMLRDELDATMGMCGRTTVDSVDRECLVGVSPYWRCFPMPPRSAKGGPYLPRWARVLVSTRASLCALIAVRRG